MSSILVKHHHKPLIALDLSQSSKKRKSLCNLTFSESTEILSTKISIKPLHQNKRPSIYTTEMISKSFKAPCFRKDVYGNIISKGSKEHKVSFIDNVAPQRIAEVILIEAQNSPKGKNGYKSRNFKREKNNKCSSFGSGDCVLV